MSLLTGLRTWWQLKTGEDETPFDGQAPVWVISMLVHLVLMFVLSFMYIEGPPKPIATIVQAAPIDEQEEELFELTDDFTFAELPTEDIGSNSFDISEAAKSEAMVVTDMSQVPSPDTLITETTSEITIDNTIQVATGLHYSENLPVRGAAGQGETGATGAVDRITHEILLKLEERKTLVVWLFDKSPSMIRQRSEVINRFDRIYEELGVIEASGNEAFAKHDDKPLLTSVVSFGQEVDLLTEEPTDNVAEIKELVSGIANDTTGVENVFSAVWQSTTAYKNFRIPDSLTREPDRNVMLVVFTDERGDDQMGADKTIQLCRRYAIPVYIVGVPAPFGREETLVKWVDPDPEENQTPGWGEVNQGPESCMPERIKLSFGAERDDKNPIDSGFGPFALTRLAYETGGMYFAVHPNRNVNRAVSRNETAAFSAHLEQFFDPTIMSRYRPEYVSGEEYMRRVNSNRARLALHMASKATWLTPMEEPKLKFVKRDEATFSGDLTEAQKSAAKLEPLLLGLFDVLKKGEVDREKEATPRWQAGFDLAIGRVMAVMVRTQAYNMMLASAKRGLKFENEKNNTWTLTPADTIEVGSQMEKAADKAREYLERVVRDHEGTPWAYLAQRELDRPLGWTWEESFTAPPSARMGGGGNNNNPARNDERNKLKRGAGPPKVPKL
ncbi:MAG: vWA domain-containing protein [Pirellulaceae bacterium]